MMSIACMSVGSEQYYTRLAREDYYSQGGEREGEWMGEGARRLGLAGVVRPDVLGNLIRGMSPDGKEQLVQLGAIRADRVHSAGWDCTFSPPKGVSVLWGLTHGEAQAAVESCHRQAVVAAVDYLQQNAAFTRRGSGGIRIEPCELVVAAFEHGTSRNQDPQIHTHCLVLNVAPRQDGTTGTIISSNVYDHQLAAGQVYRAQLAIGLKTELGIRLVPDQLGDGVGDGFRIEGIPEEVEQAFSTRRAEILAAMKEARTSGPEAAERAALATRQVKGHVSQEVLRERWSATAESLGLGQERVWAILSAKAESQGVGEQHANRDEVVFPKDWQRPGFGSAKNRVAPEEREQAGPKPTAGAGRSEREKAEKSESEQAGRESTSASEERHRSKSRQTREEGESASSTNARSKTSTRPGDEEDVLDRVAAEALAAALSPRMTARLFDEIIERVRNSQDDNLRPPDWAARRAQAEEALAEVTDIAGRLAADPRHKLGEEHVERRLGRTWKDRPDKAALHDVLTHGSAVTFVQAKAGVETDQFIKALGKEYKRAASEVRAFAARATAAAELERASGIITYTVGQLLYRLDPPIWDEVKHGLRQVVRAARGWETNPFERWTLNSRTTLVITEAHRLSSVEMRQLLQQVESSKARLVLLGDPQQRGQREPHNVFEELLKGQGKRIALAEPPRQTEVWMQDAVRQVARDDVRGALSQYVLAGRLRVEHDHNAATASIVSHWFSLPKSERGAQTLMIAGNREDSRILNALAQSARRQNGELGRIMRFKVNEEWFYRHDRVLFLGGNKGRGYRAGEMGTIERIGLNEVTIKLDRKNKVPIGLEFTIRVHVPRKSFGDLALGYAVDTHQAQGMSAKRALVLPERSGKDIPGLLVQLSAGREETRIFAGWETVGDDVGHLAEHIITQRVAEEMEQQKQKAQKNEQQNSHRQEIRP